MFYNRYHTFFICEYSVWNMWFMIYTCSCRFVYMLEKEAISNTFNKVKVYTSLYQVSQFIFSKLKSPMISTWLYLASFIPNSSFRRFSLFVSSLLLQQYMQHITRFLFLNKCVQLVTASGTVLSVADNINGQQCIFYICEQAEEILEQTNLDYLDMCEMALISYMYYDDSNR